jgi:hypothetical protein
MEGRGMEKVGILYAYLEYIAAIWYMLWPFGNLATIWCPFPRFGNLCQEKSGNPASKSLEMTGTVAGTFFPN